MLGGKINVQRIGRWFSGMHAGIFVLAVIACTLALGGFIFPGIYRSAFFCLLMAILCVHTTLCGVRWLWKELRPVGGLPNPQGAAFYFSVMNSGADPAAVRAALMREMKLAGFTTVAQEAAGGGCILRGKRGLTGAWGIFGAHLSIGCIALGVCYGATAGYDTTVTLKEGTGQTIMQAGGQPFELVLNKLSTVYYDDGSVSDWIADVTVAQNGEAVLRRELRVNHPLAFNGIKVFLAAQGTMLRVSVLDYEHKILSSAETVAGEEAGIPGPGGSSIHLLHFIPDFDARRPMLSKTQEPRNPYVIYTVRREGKPEKRYAAPLNEVQPIDGEAMSVMFSQGRALAGLHVKYDPGLPLVWVGCGLLVFGVFFSYGTPYRRLWVHWPAHDGALVTCAGYGPKLAIIEEKIRSLLTGDKGG